MTEHEERRTAGEGGDRPQVGSVAEEAAKLFGALHDWAGESGPGRAGEAADGLLGSLRSAGDHVGHGEDCRYCPVCQAIRMVRETSPEVREHLAVAIGSLAQAATAALRQSSPADASDHGSRGSGPEKVDLDD